MKHKRSLLGLLLMTSLNMSVIAEEIPYSIFFKYITKVPFETVVEKMGDDIYVQFDDLSNFKGMRNKDNLKKITVNNIEYVKVSDFAIYKDSPDSYIIEGELKPNYMPLQEWNLLGNKYTITPTGEPVNYLNYNFTYNNSKESLDGLFNFVSSNGRNKYLDVNFGYSNKLNLGSISYNIYDEENKRRWVLGSSFNQNMLGNKLNYFGIKMTSDHSINPTYNDKVNSTFDGQLDVESVASLFINDNAYRQYRLRPGDFKFNNISNTLTSDGQAKLIIKDINGNEKIITQNLFGAPLNLGEGKSKYGFDFGINRDSETNNFNKWLMSGNYSYGITDRFTVKSDFQASNDGGNLNFGIISALNGFSISPSLSLGSSGRAFGIDVLRTSKEASINLLYRKYQNYTDGVSMNNMTSDTLMVAGSTRLFGLPISANIAKQGSNYNFGIGTGFEINKDTHISFDFNKSTISGNSFFINLKFNLGDRVTNVNYNSRENAFTTGFANSSNQLDKLNYNTTFVKYEDHSVLNGDINYSSDYGSYGVFASNDTSSNKTYLQLSTSGSILYNNNKLNFGRSISDSVLYFDADHEGLVFKDGSGYAGKTSNNGVVYMPINSYSDVKMYVDTENTSEFLLTDQSEYSGNSFPRSLLRIKPKVEEIK